MTSGHRTAQPVPHWKENMDSTDQQCTLIKRLSQDMLETAFNAPGWRAAYPRCDSSDCLVCQGQRTFCSQAVTDQVCSWLERRLSASMVDVADAGSACQPSEDSMPEPQQRRKRLKRVPSDKSEDSSSLVRACSALDAGECQFSRSLDSSRWSWREDWADRTDPAPCSIIEVASLQAAGDSRGANNSNRRHDMICGLEFSLDGQLLAAAGVSKQVALYQLASLQEQQQQQQAASSSNSSRSSSQVDLQQHQHHQQQHLQQQHHQQREVPSLPPVVIVRLPGKISSIAWCPDMEGVLSVGDYDGTLTQVHMASGHYLNEIDAHSGRRIWSVCHSRLRPNLAATASDDSTAKLWSGRGFSAAVATITLPGKPAVCGVDFSQTDAQLLALAAADSRVYLYDLRRLSEPLTVLHGHRRPVSYAKFFGPGQLISASTDGTIAAWDLSSAVGSSSYTSGTAIGSSSSTHSAVQASTCSSSGGCGSGSTFAGWQQQQPQQQWWEQQYTSSRSSSGNLLQPWKVFKGHTNEKNFVGLSVLPSAGLMAVGSESGEVYTYHTSWSDPLAKYNMAGPQQQQQQQGVLQQQLQQPPVTQWPHHQQQSVCAVAWRPPTAASFGNGLPGGMSSSELLAASTSVGTCKLLALVDP